MQGVHENYGACLFSVTLYAIFEIEFVAYHHWKKELETVNLSSSTTLNSQK